MHIQVVPSCLREDKFVTQYLQVIDHWFNHSDYKFKYIKIKFSSVMIHPELLYFVIFSLNKLFCVIFTCSMGRLLCLWWEKQLSDEVSAPQAHNIFCLLKMSFGVLTWADSSYSNHKQSSRDGIIQILLKTYLIADSQEKMESEALKWKGWN